MSGNLIRDSLLATVADLHAVPEGAYNIRENGKLSGRKSTDEITIENKTDKPGIVITVKNGTKNRSVHIPVIITETGIQETVYNDFHIGDDCDVLIVAGCGIHNTENGASAHDGVHTLYIGKNSKVRYIEKHFAEGQGKKVMKPKMAVFIGEGSKAEIETVQLGGVSHSERETEIYCEKDAAIDVTERIMTSDDETVTSKTSVFLNGENSNAKINSRSVAKGNSNQVFYPSVTGNAKCFGHVQCDTIIMDGAKVKSIPEVCANSVDAQLIHEAAIGKIAGEQILKLMTLGLTHEEAEERILAGLLK